MAIVGTKKGELWNQLTDCLSVHQPIVVVVVIVYLEPQVQTKCTEAPKQYYYYHRQPVWFQPKLRNMSDWKPDKSLHCLQFKCLPTPAPAQSMFSSSPSLVCGNVPTSGFTVYSQQCLWTLSLVVLQLVVKTDGSETDSNIRLRWAIL